MITPESQPNLVITSLPTIFEPKRHPDDGWILADPREVRPSTQRVIDTLVDVIVPPEPRDEETPAKIAKHLRVMLQYMPRITALGFIATLHIINWAPLWRTRGFRPLTRRTRTEALAEIKSLSSSRVMLIRLLLLGPQGLILSCYFDQDVAHRALNYEPSGFTKSRIELRKRLLQGNPVEPADEIHHMPAGES